MPNGYHGSKGEWDRLEAPLVELDPVIKSFAESHKMELSSNYHNWPERSLTAIDELHRKIQIFMKNEEPPTFVIGAYAWRDIDANRYLKSEFVTEAVPLSALRLHLLSWLEQSYKTVMAWKPEELEFATRIQKAP